MTDAERHEQVDLPFYRREIAPWLPPAGLFHDNGAALLQRVHSTKD